MYQPMAPKAKASEVLESVVLRVQVDVMHMYRSLSMSDVTEHAAALVSRPRGNAGVPIAIMNRPETLSVVGHASAGHVSRDALPGRIPSVALDGQETMHMTQASRRQFIRLVAFAAQSRPEPGGATLGEVGPQTIAAGAAQRLVTGHLSAAASSTGSTIGAEPRIHSLLMDTECASSRSAVRPRLQVRPVDSLSVQSTSPCHCNSV